MQDRLLRRRYHPFPLLRFEVPKSGNRVRYLSVPTVRDRVLQTAVYLVTREVFEAEFEECSYVYREGLSVKHAVRRIDELRRQGFRWVVDADIEGFFDNIDHERLIERLGRLPLDPYVLSLFRRWIRAETVGLRHQMPLTDGEGEAVVGTALICTVGLRRNTEKICP